MHIRTPIHSYHMNLPHATPPTSSFMFPLPSFDFLCDEQIHEFVKIFGKQSFLLLVPSYPQPRRPRHRHRSALPPLPTPPWACATSRWVGVWILGEGHHRRHPHTSTGPAITSRVAAYRVVRGSMGRGAASGGSRMSSKSWTSGASGGLTTRAWSCTTSRTAPPPMMVMT